NQIHYWLQKKKVGVIYDDKKWIYNTAEEWARQLLVSTRTVERYISAFLKLGVIKVEKLSSHKSNRTNFLTLNYESLENLTPHTQHYHTVKNGDFSILNNDKMSESARQNVGMVIQENTNKDLNNKSEKMINNTLTKKQAEQVIDKKIDVNGAGDETNNVSCQYSQINVKNTTVQDMLVLWNNSFPSSSTRINKDLAPLLLSAFKQKCDHNMKRWENYLHRLQSSAYITSEAFNLSLNWALKFKTMDRIFKGELGVKDIPVQLDEKTEEGRALDHIQGCVQLETDACCQIRLLVLQKLGAHVYNAWFTKVIFVQKDGELKMIAENKFVEDYILQHFGHLFSL
ncbi:MAG: DnaA N-terminal domain-containing protein, partial [Alphaproteobacteria bacterium]|nr:DnaA N-terminal domain-containing protein [Alphaproteobacteria bacterium]